MVGSAGDGVCFLQLRALHSLLGRLLSDARLDLGLRMSHALLTKIAGPTVSLVAVIFLFYFLLLLLALGRLQLDEAVLLIVGLLVLAISIGL